MDTPDRLAILDKHVERIIKFTVGGVATLYVLGFLVTTAHYAHFHIITFTIIKPQYILAGTWATMPIAFAVFMLYLGKCIKADMSRASKVSGSELTFKNRHPRWSVALEFSSIFFGYWFVSALSLFVMHVAVWTMSGDGPLSAMPHWGMFGVAALFSMPIRWLWDDVNQIRALSGNAQMQSNLPKIIATLIGIVTGLVVYLAWFGGMLYAHIPSSIGGGLPTNVVFLLKADAHGSDRNLPPSPSDRPGYSRVYPLLLETETNYYVVDISMNGDGEVINFRRDSVDGYIVTVEKSVVSRFMTYPTTTPVATTTPTATAPGATASGSRPTGS